MNRKGTYKIVTVVEEVKAPTEFSGRMVTFERYSCGHYCEKPEIRETAKMIGVIFRIAAGKPQKRRCFECVSGKTHIPEISKKWRKEHEANQTRGG